MDSRDLGRCETDGDRLCNGSSLDVNARRNLHGVKVRFAFPNNGYEREQDRAKFVLSPYKIYTIDFMVQSAFSTNIYLQEMPGEPFNSVFFAEVLDPDIVVLEEKTPPKLNF